MTKRDGFGASEKFNISPENLGIDVNSKVLNINPYFIHIFQKIDKRRRILQIRIHKVHTLSKMVTMMGCNLEQVLCTQL